MACIAAGVLLALPDTNSASTNHVIPEARARTYGQVSNCLLTDPSGIQGAFAAAVWAGMESASAANHAQVSYLAIQGPDTTANAEIYINTLAMRGCSTILVAGSVSAQAAVHRAASWANQRLVTVTTTAPASSTSGGGKLTTISSGSLKSVTAQVKALLMSADYASAPAT
jgi:hypothetical protein